MDNYRKQAFLYKKKKKKKTGESRKIRPRRITALFITTNFNHSHKKRKGSLDPVLFAAELELPKILVPRLPQNTSNVNIECEGKSKQLHSLS